MALQLPLPFSGMVPEPRRLWVLGAAPEHLDVLHRQLLLGGPEALIDSATGGSPVRDRDAILLRVDAGQYRAFGDAAALCADASAHGVDLTSEILAARGAAPAGAVELLAATVGRPPPRAAPGGPRNSLEALFGALGGPRRPDPELRLALCTQAIDNLDDDQVWLRAFLAAQASQLARAISGRWVTNVPQTLGALLPTRPGFRRLTLAPTYRAAGPPQLHLFPDDSAPRTEGVTGLSAYRVWGASLPLAPAQGPNGLTRFSEGFEIVRLDEDRLGTALGPLVAREVAAFVRPAAPGTLVVSIDFELRQRLGCLFPAARTTADFQLWVEDFRGWAVMVANRIRIGQEFTVPTAALRRRDRISGVVAFRGAGGRVARRRFAFAADESGDHGVDVECLVHTRRGGVEAAALPTRL